MKKIILFMVLIFGLCIPSLNVRAYDAKINKMQITMVVSSSGLISTDIRADVNFAMPSHGIYVYVPQKYKMNWIIDEKKITRTYQWPVINLKVYDGVPYQRTITDGNLFLRMGDPNVLITGNKSYHYSYDIQTQDLGLGGIQLFYMNLVGTGWELPIDEVEYTITLPKDWPSEITLYQGPYGSTTTIMSFTVNGKVLTGTASNLLPNEGLTIYSVLSKESGFISYDVPKDVSLIIILSSLGVLIVMILIFQKFGKDRPLVVTPQFEPIKGLSASQVSYIVNGTVTPSDMVSLILEWAYKGYLKIIDNDDPKQVTLEELQEIPLEENEADRSFFDDVFLGRPIVTIKELQEDIHDKLHETVTMIINHFELIPENRIFDVKSFVIKFILGIAGLTPFFVLLGHQLALNMNMDDGPAVLVFLMVFALALLGLWMKLIERWLSIETDRKYYLIGLGVCTGLFYLIGYVLALTNVFVGQQLITLKYSVISVITTVSVGIGLLMDRRSELGTELLGKVIGLKNFIEFAEKDRIIELTKDDPTYFYKLLPYAYVFGISETWTRKFQEIAVEPPSWFISERTFESIDFSFRLMNNLRALKIDVPSIRASKEVGGALLRIGGAVIEVGSAVGRAGGHSGGGFGGGGGGRW